MKNFPRIATLAAAVAVPLVVGVPMAAQAAPTAPAPAPSHTKLADNTTPMSGVTYTTALNDQTLKPQCTETGNQKQLTFTCDVLEEQTIGNPLVLNLPNDNYKVDVARSSDGVGTVWWSEADSTWAHLSYNNGYLRPNQNITLTGSSYPDAHSQGWSTVLNVLEAKESVATKTTITVTNLAA